MSTSNWKANRLSVKYYIFYGLIKSPIITVECPLRNNSTLNASIEIVIVAQRYCVLTLITPDDVTLKRHSLILLQVTLTQTPG